MMYTIKNCIMTKCLQVLLIAYFLLSSIAVTNSLKNSLVSSPDIHTTENSVTLIFKKFFKYSCTEEIDDYETEAEGTKSLISFDYIVPGHHWLLTGNRFINFKGNIYNTNVDFTCRFYSKIHLPPPENIV